MSSRRFSIRILVGLLPVVLGIVLVSGCDDAYDVNILYPGRTDFLVEKPPTVKPTRYDPPGLLPLLALDGDKDSFGPDQDLLSREREQNHTILDPRTLDQATLQQINLALRDLAGRPRMPKIDLNHNDYEETNKALVRELKLDRKTLAEGSRIYRTQCLHCHGLTGDGRGPTGPWVNPHPRDFRQGIFKFTSSGQDLGVRKPRREDLRRTLMNGIEGTSMPSFALLGSDQIEALISYVIHLSIRGETEYSVMIDLVKEADEKKKSPSQSDDSGPPIIQRVREAAERTGQRWLEAQKSGVVPNEDLAKKFESMTHEQRLESAARGYEIFATKELSACGGCHVNFGRDAQFSYDAWGTIIRPRNLTLTQLNLRGGRRPIDLYWRIRMGINGADMPPLINNDADLAATAPTDVKLKHKLGVKEEWIWDLVNFVQLIPYPEVRKDLKAKYGIEID